MQKSEGARRNRRYIPAAAAVLLAVLLAMIALDTRLLIRQYTVEAEGVDTPVRIVLVTDLHSCRYGEAQTELIDAVIGQEPDLVVMAGDIFDDVIGNENTALFLDGIAGRFPMYYVTGNHEWWSGAEKFAAQMAILREYGVTVLSGDAETLTVGGATFNLCGVDDPEAFVPAGRGGDSSLTAQLERVSAIAENGNYTVLLAHRPEYFDTYREYAFDLVLCGHAHGGQWRIPGLLNGLYAPHQGWFPPYAGGRYEADGMTAIVSRGLARESTRVPRIFNRPELVVIDLQ